jgi:hypothetical protein
MFNVEGWKVSTWRELEIGADETLQSFVIDGSRIIASQGVPVKGQDVENLRLTLMDSGGNRLETATLVGGGHGTIISGLGGLKIVLDFHGQLAEFAWKAGTHTLSSPSLKPWGGVYQRGAVYASVDIANKNALFRKSLDADTKEYTVVPLFEVRDQNMIPPLGQFTLSQAGKVFQGMALWKDQMFWLAGTAKADQRLYSYDIRTGRKQWDRPAAYLKTPNQEPEGVFVSSQWVVSGNPMVYIGYTVRFYNSDGSFRRRSFIVRLRDHDSRLTTDAGQYYVDPAKVSTHLNGRNAAREIVKQRPPGFNLWGEKIITKWDQKQLVTTYGTHYDMRFLAKGAFGG